MLFVMSIGMLDFFSTVLNINENPLVHELINGIWKVQELFERQRLERNFPCGNAELFFFEAPGQIEP